MPLTMIAKVGVLVASKAITKNAPAPSEAFAICRIRKFSYPCSRPTCASLARTRLLSGKSRACLRDFERKRAELSWYESSLHTMIARAQSNGGMMIASIATALLKDPRRIGQLTKLSHPQVGHACENQSDQENGYPSRLRERLRSSRLAR